MAATDALHHPDQLCAPEDLNQQENVDPHWELREKVARLSEENQSLRLELGQEYFKLRKLERLRERAAEMQRAGAHAKAVELRAQKQIREAKTYVERNATSAQNEKTRLLDQMQSLELRLQEVTQHEDELRTELRDTLNDTSRASWLVGETKREAEDWKKEAGKLRQRAQQAEQRLQQSEQRRNDERAKLKTVATHLQNAASSGAAGKAVSKCLAALDVDSVASIDKLARACTTAHSMQAKANAVKLAPAPSETHHKAAAAHSSQGISSWSMLTMGRKLTCSLGSWAALGSAFTAGKGSSPGSGQKQARKQRSSTASATSLESESRLLHQEVLLLLLISVIAGMAAAKILF